MLPSGSAIQSHWSGAPFWKLTSCAGLKNEWNEILGWAALMPDWPPSPPTASSQSLVLPPWIRVHPGAVVLRAADQEARDSGIHRDALELQRLQAGVHANRCASAPRRARHCRGRAIVGPRPRTLHPKLGSVAIFAKEPLVRTIPPSEPAKAMSGLLEAKASACWSGCIPMKFMS